MNQLATYLNDHLAGSVAAVELLEHLIKTHEGSPLAEFFQRLRADVVADQEILRKLVKRFKADEGPIRKAGAWLVEKFSRARIRVSGEKAGELGLMQALEVLVLGVTGKQLLWRSLSATFSNSPLLKGINLDELEQRAIEQIERVEAKRLEAAREVFLGK
jgi:hypothetical protein